MEFRRRKNPAQPQTDEIPKKRRKEEKCFEINEKILCFEPDEKLEKVLYDAKIRDVQEIIRKGKKCYEYLVHFQGWNSSWDRKVCEDYILKDTPENRKLQRELAEKKQLQLGAYLYRKERKKRKKLIERNLLSNASNNNNSTEDAQKKPTDLDPELYFSSSTTESHDDDRIFLHIGEILKKNLELDHKMVTKEKIYTKLPTNCCIISILEDFVRTYALKVLTKPQQEPTKPRKISILNRSEPKMKPIDYDAIINDINLCKEIADGLRVYFNFILNDFLLYPEEKDEIERAMEEEKIKNFKFVPAPRPTLNEFLSQIKIEPITETKRISRLRSHSLKTDDDEKVENMSSMASTSSNDSFMPEKRTNFTTNLNPMAMKIMEDVLNWHLIDADANGATEPSMIFGIHHLSRLIVKLPEFLSATPMSEEKITELLKYLDAFVEFMEENSEKFGSQKFDDEIDVKDEVKEEEI
ncbi:hypothetical protein PVAND_016632 [Polypedilum vanderplanki]|uniref:Protein male-specific lethal-3 n=1 Tax=Polypedilum vanderplanki TaxID=319348 RepID=A0A9J6BGI3_POLVA|nr:hypothetical protein PVAND_016632 [Polypedilum vanderplanki]